MRQTDRQIDGISPWVDVEIAIGGIASRPENESSVQTYVHTVLSEIIFDIPNANWNTLQ